MACGKERGRRELSLLTVSSAPTRGAVRQGQKQGRCGRRQGQVCQRRFSWSTRIAGSVAACAYG